VATKNIIDTISQEEVRPKEVSANSKDKAGSGAKLKAPSTPVAGQSSDGKKFSPDCIALRSGQFQTVSDLVSFWEG